MGSKIVRFLWKMDGPGRYLDKANLSSIKKGKQCTTFGCSNTFYGPNSLPVRFYFKFMHDYACIFDKYLSFYTYFIFCELRMRVTIFAKLVQIIYLVPELF